MPWGPTRGSERRLARRPVPATSPPLSPLTGATRGRFRPVPHVPGRSAPHADGPCVSLGSECSPGAVSAKGGVGDPAWPHTPRPAEKPCPLARPGGSPRPSGHGGFESARGAAAVPGRVSGHCPGAVSGAHEAPRRTASVLGGGALGSRVVCLPRRAALCLPSALRLPRLYGLPLPGDFEFLSFYCAYFLVNTKFFVDCRR